jgi:hypothetical protein
MVSNCPARDILKTWGVQLHYCTCTVRRLMYVESYCTGSSFNTVPGTCTVPGTRYQVLVLTSRTVGMSAVGPRVGPAAWLTPAPPDMVPARSRPDVPRTAERSLLRSGPLEFFSELMYVPTGTRRTCVHIALSSSFARARTSRGRSKRTTYRYVIVSKKAKP